MQVDAPVAATPTSAPAEGTTQETPAESTPAQNWNAAQSLLLLHLLPPPTPKFPLPRFQEQQAQHLQSLTAGQDVEMSEEAAEKREERPHGAFRRERTS